MRILRVLLFSLGSFTGLITLLLMGFRDQSPAPPWIVFTYAPNGQTDIYRTRTSHAEWEQLTFTAQTDESPAVSPDGRWLGYASQTADEQWTIFRQSINGYKPTPLISGFTDIHELSWSPDGKWLAFAAKESETWNLYRIRPDGSQLEALTKSDFVNSWSPAWSPQGDWIVFNRQNETGVQLFRVKADGSSSPEQLSDGIGDNWNALWSPNGSKIVFLSSREIDVEIYQMKADGSQVHRIGQRPSYTWYHRYPKAWHGDLILLDIFRNGYWATYQMRSDGTTLEKVTILPAETRFSATPVWSPIVDYQWHSGILGGLSLVFLLSGFAYRIRFPKRVRY